MNHRIQKVLNNLSSEWKEFAYGTGLNPNIVESIDLDDRSDEFKLKSFLEELIKSNPSNFMTLVEKSLAVIGNLDILNRIHLIQANELLKSYYIKSYAGMLQLGQHQANTDVNLVMRTVELTSIEATDTFDKNHNEWEYFLQKFNKYKITSLNDVFSKQLQILLLSIIDNRGRTNFLQKCLFFWAKGLLWKNADLVLYFKFKKLNEFCQISSIRKLINKFYKNIVKGLDILLLQAPTIFIIDGLDEFIYLNQLYNHNSPNNLPIIKTLVQILSSKNSQCILGGKVEAMLRCCGLVREFENIMYIQIMDFSNFGLRNFYGSSLLCETLRNGLENLITFPPVAKAMLSVAFNLTAVCSAFSLSTCSYLLKTMTELQTLIFLYLLQQSCNTEKPLYQLMQINKPHILKVCKVAYNLLKEKKIMASQAELAAVLDENGIELFGFIKPDLNHQYQFIHPILMNFCASIHLYFYKNPQKVFEHETLRYCLPVACGLLYNNGRNFVSLVSQLQVPYHKGKLCLRGICDILPKDYLRFNDNDQKLFVECFFEAQASITEQLKKSIDERCWEIVIRDGKTAHEVCREKYFFEKSIDAGIKLYELVVRKNVLSEDEKNLVIKCSSNVRFVYLYYPLKIDGWSPKHQIEVVEIDTRETFVSKNEFEGFLPWIRLAKKLYLELHNDTNYTDDICEWLLDLNLELLEITYRGEYFNIEELRNFKQ